MKSTLNILVVEDSKDAIDLYKRAVKTHNRTDSKYSIEIETTNNKEDALEKLTRIDNSFDGAIIDLDLADSKSYDDSSGREVIQAIKKNLRFPVFVISGTIHSLTVDEKEENDLYKVVDRDDDSFYFIDEFIKIHSTGITEIINRTGIIEDYINKIYWEHLSSSLKPWMDNNSRTDADKKKSLIRYVIFHLQEYLDISNEDDEYFLEYFPAEFFITGPIKAKMFTGDIFIYNSFRYVAITPACDFGNNKADRILCLKIKELNQVNAKFTLFDMSKTAKKDLKPFLTNNKPRYHFIPSLYYKNKDYSSGIIDFQDQTSFDYEEINDVSKVTRIATISQPFLKDLIERYSRYYARQGAPNISRKQLEDTYLS